jgi:serine/threonine protein phosphatase 1
MSTFAIGDIHGNEPALGDLLAQLQPLAQPADTVVFLGDYIDRGPRSKQCIERILEFRQACAATVVALLGNHEITLLDTHHDFTDHSWLIAMDAWPTIESYSTQAAARLRSEAKAAAGRLYSPGHRLPYELFFDALPDGHLKFFQDLKPYYRTPDALCVHAGIDPARGPIESQSQRNMLWGSYRFPDLYQGPETIAYGHYGDAVLDDNRWPHPVVQEHSIGVDTIKHGVLTAVQLPGRRLFQSARYDVC